MILAKSGKPGPELIDQIERRQTFKQFIVASKPYLDLRVSSADLVEGNLLNKEDDTVLEEEGEILPEVVVGDDVEIPRLELDKLDNHAQDYVHEEEGRKAECSM